MQIGDVNLTDKEREARSGRARDSTLERLGPVTASWKHLGASCERLGAFQSILGASCERLGAFQSISCLMSSPGNPKKIKTH